RRTPRLRRTNRLRAWLHATPRGGSVSERRDHVLVVWQVVPAGGTGVPATTSSSPAVSDLTPTFPWSPRTREIRSGRSQGEKSGRGARRRSHAYQKPLLARSESSCTKRLAASTW